jgi:threonine/homoserine/homoserine lactone efflux protein
MGRMLEIGMFLLGVAVVTLSGTLIPGPLTAILVGESRKNEYAGSLLTLGHAIVELPLILLIGLGFAPFFTHPAIRAVISVAGGAMLVFMGVRMVQERRGQDFARETCAQGILVGGITGTLNPTFFVWWASAGSAIVLSSLEFGLMGFALFIGVHYLSDLAYNQLISSMIYKTKNMWTKEAYGQVSAVGGILLCLFGGYFLYCAAELLL